MLATLSTKGQVTIPKALREHLRLKEGDKVEFVVHDDGRVEVVAVTAPIARLRGMAPKPRSPVSLKDMDHAIRTRGGKR